MVKKSQGLIGCYRAGKMMYALKTIQESAMVVSYYELAIEQCIKDGIPKRTWEAFYKIGLKNEPRN